MVRARRRRPPVRRPSRRAAAVVSPSAPWITVARVLLNLDEFVTRE